jgi:hypothetical protein
MKHHRLCANLLNFEDVSAINPFDIPLVESGFDTFGWSGRVGGAFATQVSLRGLEPFGMNLLVGASLAFWKGVSA